MHLSDSSALQTLDGADTTALGDELAHVGLAELLDSLGVEHDLERVGGGEAGLEGLPDLLLGVEDALGLAVPALEEDPLSGLGALGRGDELDGALVFVDLALLEFRGGGEHHGGGLDAAHLDGLEVADDDDLAALHLLERDQAVEARADGAADLALILGSVLAGGVAHGDGGDVEGVGVRVLDGLEDVADAEVDEGGREGRGGGGGLGLFGSLLLLLLLVLGLSRDGLLGLGGDLLDLLLGAVDEGGVTAGSGSSGGGGLLLLQALLLGLGVDGLLDEADVVGVNLDLALVLDGEAEDGRVLDEVDEADDVGVSLLAGSLVGGPLGDDGGEGLVDGNVGLAGLDAEKGGSAGEVAVEGLDDGGLVVAGLEALGGGEPLLDLGLLGGGVGLGGNGGHGGGESVGGSCEGSGAQTPGDEGSEGEQLCGVLVRVCLLWM